MCIEVIPYSRASKSVSISHLAVIDLHQIKLDLLLQLDLLWVYHCFDPW